MHFETLPMLTASTGGRNSALEYILRKSAGSREKFTKSNYDMKYFLTVMVMVHSQRASPIFGRHLAANGKQNLL
jgi:hypothetical protein